MKPNPDEIAIGEKRQREIISRLNKKLVEEAGPKIMRPTGEHVSLLVYMEDLHLTSFDTFGDNPTAETLRELVARRQWYSSQKKSHRRVEQVNLMACMTTNND